MTARPLLWQLTIAISSTKYKHRVIEIADGRIIRDQEGGEYEDEISND